MKKALEQQISELEERRQSYEKEKQAWEQSNNVTLEELRRRSLEANSKEWVLLHSYLCVPAFYPSFLRFSFFY